MNVVFLTVPGLAGSVESELNDLSRVSVTETGFDGRADVVRATGTSALLDQALTVRTAEDVLLEVCVRQLHGDPSSKEAANVLWDRVAFDRALSSLSRTGFVLARDQHVRVVVRVLDERSFLRTQLRDDFVSVLLKERPRWEIADPADLEIWILEFSRRRFSVGFRMTPSDHRRRGGRQIERPASLRPVVAAAMLRLPGPGQRLVLDPFCGGGTILQEAMAVRRVAIGSDISEEAIVASEANVPGALLIQADASALPFRESSCDAIVSNLPFGSTYRLTSPLNR